MVAKVNKKVGVKDIAANAGVSIGTVDRVLHNRGEVKEETRMRVMQIVKELDYQPNLQAQSLSSKKTTHIAIVFPDSSDNNPYWEKPIEGIKKAAVELSSYNTRVSYEFFDASNEASFKKVLTKVCESEPDGIVLSPVFRAASLKFIENFKKRKIPYVFIDVNIKGVDKLGYFGQDAEQSGLVAATLMAQSLQAASNIMILKQTNKKVFSQHIEAREIGFRKYFIDKKTGIKHQIITVEIDLLDKAEPGRTLDQAYQINSNFAGIFVPNSRAFKLAEYLERRRTDKPIVIGYDLVDGNVQYLEKGLISYLISQKPEVQAYNAIYALFDHLISRKEVAKTNYSPIDIIVRENLEYYTGRRAEVQV